MVFIVGKRERKANKKWRDKKGNITTTGQKYKKKDAINTLFFVQ
jgi:hypothetical protein